MKPAARRRSVSDQTGSLDRVKNPAKLSKGSAERGGGQRSEATGSRHLRPSATPRAPPVGAKIAPGYPRRTGLSPAMKLLRRFRLCIGHRLCGELGCRVYQ